MNFRIEDASRESTHASSQVVIAVVNRLRTATEFEGFRYVGQIISCCTCRKLLLPPSLLLMLLDAAYWTLRPLLHFEPQDHAEQPSRFSLLVGH